MADIKKIRLPNNSEYNVIDTTNIKVGSSTVSGNNVELVAGSNVTLTPDTTNKKVTIDAADSSLQKKSTAGIVYSDANATSTSAATAAQVVSTLGNTAVNRATGDESGNNISTTYAPLASPVFTGTPTAPTATTGTNTTQVATTAFVKTAIDAKPAITYGTANPSGGKSGDVYIKVNDNNTIGSNITPIYINAGAFTAVKKPTSGAWFSSVPSIDSSGVMEIGRYIDFHPTNTNTSNYTARFDAGTSTTARTLTLPALTATLGIQPVLLWSNSANTLAPGDITLSLSSYSHVIVGCYAWEGSGYFENIVKVGTDSMIQYTAVNTTNTSSVQAFLNGAYRSINVATSKITFGSGFMTYNGGVYQNWNNRCVPEWVWGIKYGS